MEREVIKYYNEDYSCAECVLMAAKECYHIDISEEVYDMCGILTNGMGIGALCAAVSVAVMLFGRLFDLPKAKKMRIRFLSEFHALHPNFNCGVLRCGTSAEDGCEKILRDIGRLMDEIVGD